MFMRSANVNRMIWARLDNQQNKKNSCILQQPEHIQKITGWDDEKPLLEYNLNTFSSKLNKSKQNNQLRKTNIFHPPYPSTQSKLSQRRRRNTKISSSTSQRNIQGHFQSSQNMQPIQQTSQALRYQFSNIQLLKFQAKHLENDQVSRNRFPTFQGNNKSELISNQIQQNINQFQIHQGYEVARKIRTQSTKRKKKQLTFSQNAGNNISKQMITQINHSISNGNGTALNQTTTSNNIKLYKTLTNQWINSLNKNNPNLIIQPYINNNMCPTSKQLKYDLSTQINTNNNKKQQYKTIHWKKNKPFTKFFQSKRNKSRNLSQMKQPISNVKGQIKQVQGRKLYQLLTLNRQLIQLED